MIIKELEHANGGNARVVAGRAAEEQMAHYLRRAFAGDPDILVINGLRLETEDDAAQIDHLIIHPYGLIIIESKSVTTRLRVSAQGLLAPIPHGSGQTPLREFLLVAAHYTYHIGEFAILRQVMGTWPPTHR